MTICLVMNAKNEEDCIRTAFDSVKDLIDTWVICDTGSTDKTQDIIRGFNDEIPGRLVLTTWKDFGFNRTLALKFARRRATDWLLWMDADTIYEYVSNLKEWLDTDPDPTVDAWNVHVDNNGLSYRLPLLMRGGIKWEYKEPIHEYLDTNGHTTRDLLGLTLIGKSGGNRDPEGDLDLLRPGFEAREPRATFYYAQTLKDMGRIEEAIAAYLIRVDLEGWEEETWYAKYQAHYLDENLDGLLACYFERPWRHEPLTAAGRIISRRPNSDSLFQEVLS